MGKNVYSIVLRQDVVEAVDLLAYQKGTSRSNLINQILAERVCCITPEMRMRDVFASMEAFFEQQPAFRLHMSPGEEILQLRSAVRYKYNPTLRYTVELHANPEGTIGILRVGLRTQSTELLQLLEQFYRLWAKLETAYLAEHFESPPSYKVEGGRYLRYLRSIGTDHQTMGNGIASYIALFDHCLKLFLDAQGSGNALSAHDALRTVEQFYKKNYKKAVF